MSTRNVEGWLAVLLVTLASSAWAFWGVNEAFHEGWCKHQLWMRLLQFLEYLGPASVLSLLTVVSLRWPHVGATLFLLVGLSLATLIILDDANFGLLITTMLTVIPALIGLLFLVGRPTPKRAAYAVSVGIPLLIAIGFGAEPVVRVSTRFDDGDRGARLVEGNGVVLLWAPAGPGWTRDGLSSWNEAVNTASHLTEDGTANSKQPQDIWRLPTREEIVRSLTRNNQNAGGTWDKTRHVAGYATRPDKESPLWDPYAPLIYLWTSEEDGKGRAWVVVYHGGVFAKSKGVGSPSNGFRAVRRQPGVKKKTDN